MTLFKMQKSELIAVKEVLSDPERWEKSGYYASDSLGLSTFGDNSRACKFCIVGAAQKIYNYHGMSVDFAMVEALGFKDINDLSNFNDWRLTTHKMLMARFDEAIAKA